MHVYRVAPKKYALDMIGEGARKFGGRWNDKGTPVIYTSEHPALAFLETFPSFDFTTSPPEIQLVTIDVPDSVRILTLPDEELPADWNARPHKNSTVLLGQRWINEGQFPVFKVPTVMTPGGSNFLLNPLHPDLQRKMSIASIIDWKLDQRFLDMFSSRKKG